MSCNARKLERRLALLEAGGEQPRWEVSCGSLIGEALASVVECHGLAKVGVLAARRDSVST